MIRFCYWLFETKVIVVCDSLLKKPISVQSSLFSLKKTYLPLCNVVATRSEGEPEVEADGHIGYLRLRIEFLYFTGKNVWNLLLFIIENEPYSRWVHGYFSSLNYIENRLLLLMAEFWPSIADEFNVFLRGEGSTKNRNFEFVFRDPWIRKGEFRKKRLKV